MRLQENYRHKPHLKLFNMTVGIAFTLHVLLGWCEIMHDTILVLIQSIKMSLLLMCFQEKCFLEANLCKQYFPL